MENTSEIKADTLEPRLWREEPVPEYANSCTSCELCRYRKRMIWGEGNPNAPLLVLLDNPGRREDSEGKPFVCGARQVLQSAAYTAGLHEDDMFVVRCRPVRKYDKEKDRGICMGYLERQLQSGVYRIVFCLGDTAVKVFFRDPEVSAKNTRGQKHTIRGFTTFTSYHPLAAKRRPALYAIFEQDWKSVAAYLRSQAAN